MAQLAFSKLDECFETCPGLSKTANISESLFDKSRESLFSLLFFLFETFARKVTDCDRLITIAHRPQPPTKKSKPFGPT